MTRVKRGIISHAKHKKILASTKGYRGTKRRLIKVATEASLHAGSYAYHGRKRKKRDFRRLWITRINGAVKEMGISYSSLIHSMKEKNILLDRKVLSVLVTEDPKTFKAIVEQATAKRAKGE